MIERKDLFHITASVVLVSILFGLLGYLKIPFQYYLWEILIDLKAAALAAIFIIGYKKRTVTLTAHQFTLLNFDWKRNIALFFVPILFYAITIGAGSAFSEVKVNTLDNAVTLILATLFDIPAIYVFSATSILLEELIFRGILLQSFERAYGLLSSIFITSGLWTLSMASDLSGMENVTLLSVFTLLFFFLTAGGLLSLLSLWKGNVWLGYSMRIGLVTLTPIILTSLLNESDSFFETDSLFFVSEGICVSLIAFLFALGIFQSVNKERKSLQN
jgi:membrane protease YdiL (CAAX protease family)